MAKKEKLKRIISHENLDAKILDMFNKKYPNGYAGFIQNIPSPKGEMLHVVPLETEDSIYLVKVKVQAGGSNKKSREEDDDEFFGDEIPEAGDGFDGDKDEFNANEEEEDNYGDGPAEDSGDDDDDEDWFLTLKYKKTPQKRGFVL